MRASLQRARGIIRRLRRSAAVGGFQRGRLDAGRRTRHLVALPNTARTLTPAVLHNVATFSTDTLPDDRLDALRFNVQLAILGHRGAGAVHDDLLLEVISQAVDAFLMESGRPVKAAQRLSPLLRSIGSREAVIGRDADDFAESFQIARVVILEELPGLLCDYLLTPAAALALRRDVLIFLDHLHTHAREGFDHAQSLARVPAALTSYSLRRSLFANEFPIDPVKFRTMATLAGLTMTNEAVPVITMGTAFPAGFVDDPRVIGGPDPHEAIVCSTVGEITLMTLAAGADGDVLILGPAVLLHDLPRSLGLARRGDAQRRTAAANGHGVALRRRPRRPRQLCRSLCLAPACLQAAGITVRAGTRTPSRPGRAVARVVGVRVVGEQAGPKHEPPYADIAQPDAHPA